MPAFWASIPLWAAVLAALAYAAATDVRERIVPNEVSLFIALSGLTLALLSRPELIWASVLISLGALVAFGLCARTGMLGGGDAKLFAAVALVVPPGRFWLVLLSIALAGGVLSGLYLAANRWLRRPVVVPSGRPARPLGRFLQAERERLRTDETVPYAVAIFSGVAAYFASEFHRCYSATSCSL
jgi:prepilin peptidase CpaA